MEAGPNAPNQGAPGATPPVGVTAEGSGPTPAQAGTAGSDQSASEERGGGGPGSTNDAFSRRPELYVGAAFAGGFAVAQLLKRLGA
jgi:hypothetical protein